MRVALVHDWLTGLRGGEKCLLAFIKLYPQADIFTLLHVPGSTHPEIDKRVKGVSFLGKLPGARKYYRFLLPLFPAAIRKFNLTGYDLIISLSHAAAKNIVVPNDAMHVCYCFTPMRYIWDQARNYFGRATNLVWPLIAKLRRWDREGAERVDYFIAISRFVASRIRCFYKKKADVIFPPIEPFWFDQPASRGEGAFLCAGALVPYKSIDLAIEAFNQLGVELIVVGSGPEEGRLRSMARDNIKFLGYVPDSELAMYYSGCRALVFPGTEDFGMVPVECMAAGRPVIALYDGALRETVTGLKPWINSTLAAAQASGVFIQKRDDRQGQIEAITKSIQCFMRLEGEFRSEVCTKQARNFSEERFFQSWRSFEERAGLSGKHARAAL